MYDEERPYQTPEQTNPQVRQSLWDVASGLQEVDGLHISEYAESVGKDYVAGTYTAHEACQELEQYHQGNQSRQTEADVVAGRILTVLSDAQQSSFRFAPTTLKAIHKTLFEGQLPYPDWIGQWRKDVITKNEPVLGGNSVAYMHPSLIAEALQHDFDMETSNPYPKKLETADVHRFADFISSVWQIHPFREGNTRTTAVFSQLYLSQLGIEPNNDYYAQNSTWFRDALVRAGYSSISQGIQEDHSFIHAFFENVALNAQHDLSTMDLNVHGIRVDETPYRKPGDMTDREADQERNMIANGLEAITAQYEQETSKRSRSEAFDNQLDASEEQSYNPYNE